MLRLWLRLQSDRALHGKASSAYRRQDLVALDEVTAELLRRGSPWSAASKAMSCELSEAYADAVEAAQIADATNCSDSGLAEAACMAALRTGDLDFASACLDKWKVTEEQRSGRILAARAMLDFQRGGSDRGASLAMHAADVALSAGDTLATCESVAAIGSIGSHDNPSELTAWMTAFRERANGMLAGATRQRVLSAVDQELALLRYRDDGNRASFAAQLDQWTEVDAIRRRTLAIVRAVDAVPADGRSFHRVTSRGPWRSDSPSTPVVGFLRVMTVCCRGPVDALDFCRAIEPPDIRASVVIHEINTTPWRLPVDYAGVYEASGRIFFAK